jgi:hypothetical protein
VPKTCPITIVFWVILHQKQALCWSCFLSIASKKAHFDLIICTSATSITLPFALLFPKEYQEAYSSPEISVAKASISKSKTTTNSQRSQSRSPSQEPEHPIAKHGRAKSNKKRSISTSRRESSQLTDNIVNRGRAPRPISNQESNVLRVINDTMAKSQAKKLKELQQQRDALLAQLRENGQTLDENGQLVPIDPNDDDNCAQTGTDDDHGDTSSSDDEAQPKKKKAKSKSKQSKKFPSRPHSSKAVANMKAQLAVTKHKKAKKKGKEIDEDETPRLIRECIHKHLWALSKFVNGEQSQDKVAAKCLELLNIKEFNGQGEQYDADRAEWIKAYGPGVTAQLNTHRSYVQNRCREACIRWMDNHEGTLPSEELLLKCLERKIDLKNDDEVAVMKWYWDDLLAMAAGNAEDWNVDKRHYVLLSTGAPPKNPESPYITPSTEAIAMTFIDNNRTRWPALFAAKQLYPKAKEIRARAKVHEGTEEFTWYKGRVGGVLLCNGEKYLTKYTETAAGQQEFTGWSKAGRDYNVAKKALNEKARKAKGTKKFEQAILDMIRADNDKTAASALEERNAKRRKSGKAKAPIVEDDDDGMEF